MEGFQDLLFMYMILEVLFSGYDVWEYHTYNNEVDSLVGDLDFLQECRSWYSFCEQPANIKGSVMATLVCSAYAGFFHFIHHPNVLSYIVWGDIITK